MVLAVLAFSRFRRRQLSGQTVYVPTSLAEIIIFPSLLGRVIFNRTFALLSCYCDWSLSGAAQTYNVIR